MENISARAARTGRDFAVIMLDFRPLLRQVNDPLRPCRSATRFWAEVAMRLREKLAACDLGGLIAAAAAERIFDRAA